MHIEFLFSIKYARIFIGFYLSIESRYGNHVTKRKKRVMINPKMTDRAAILRMGTENGRLTAAIDGAATGAATAGGGSAL